MQDWPGAACEAAAVQPRLVTRGQENAEKWASSLETSAPGRTAQGWSFWKPTSSQNPGLIAGVISPAKEWLRSAWWLFSWTFAAKLFLVKNISRSFGAPLLGCACPQMDKHQGCLSSQIVRCLWLPLLFSSPRSP